MVAAYFGPLKRGRCIFRKRSLDFVEIALLSIHPRSLCFSNSQRLTTENSQLSSTSTPRRDRDPSHWPKRSSQIFRWSSKPVARKRDKWPRQSNTILPTGWKISRGWNKNCASVGWNSRVQGKGPKKNYIAVATVFRMSAQKMKQLKGTELQPFVV